MNDYQRMLFEYVIPFTVITLILGSVVLSIPNAIDKEITMQDKITSHYLNTLVSAN